MSQTSPLSSSPEEYANVLPPGLRGEVSNTSPAPAPARAQLAELPGSEVCRDSGARSAFPVQPFTCKRVDTSTCTTWVRLTGELDLASASQLAHVLRLAQGEARELVLDLRGLTFMDCSGMNVVVDAAVRARRETRPLSVVRGAPRIDRIFELTQSSQFLETIDLGPAEPLPRLSSAAAV